MAVQSQPRQTVQFLCEKTHHKKGLLKPREEEEWRGAF
jgi:hypothetical protein